MTTKNELLATAKELNIKGRHEMSVAQLTAAIEAAQPQVEEKKTKKLVKNTNLPWQRKYYYLDRAKYEASSEEIRKIAGQARLLLKYMADHGVDNVDVAAQGYVIAENAIAAGYLKTPIEPKALFAYYRRVMEKYGLVFAGYGIA